MTDWWRGAVFYQIYPRSYCDANGDGIGDLKGITQKIPYVASLGVDAIWISPFYKSPMDDFGYDVSDYRAVDPMFGDLDDFDALLAQVHKHGMKLIVDLVLSHTSDQHDWFQESRRDTENDKADWYVWADPKPDGSPPNNWQSLFGGVAWEYDCHRGQYYMHSFLKSQPDLNVQNPVVQKELLDVARFWLERGVDGFRLDVANFYMHDLQLRDNPPKLEFDPDHVYNGLYTKPCPYDRQIHLYDKSQPENLVFVEKLRALVDEYEDCMMVAEIGDDNNMKTCTEYTFGEKRFHTAYNLELLGWFEEAQKIKDLFEEYAAYKGGWPAWAFSNHDVLRIASRGAPDDPVLQTARVKALIALLTSLRGTLYMYQGEELGLPEADVPFEKMRDPFGIFLYPDSKGRDGCRIPMPWDDKKEHAGFSEGVVDTWLPIPKEHYARAVSVQENDPQSPLNFTRAFLKWRKKFPALVSGDIVFDDVVDDVLVFTRTNADSAMRVVFNLGDTPAHYVLEETDWQIVEGAGFDGIFAEGNHYTLPPFTGVFAEKTL